MALFGVGLDVTVKKINYEFRLALKKKGGIGIKSLKVIFKRFDYNGNKKLDIAEFEAALTECGLFPKKVDVQALMKYYDIDNDGHISYDEFIRGLREPMNERRQKVVDKVYALLDKDGSGKLTVDDLKNIYQVDKHPEFIAGKKTKEELLKEFLNGFEGVQGNKDGIITKEEFYDYYLDMSTLIANDDYFVQMLESCFLISENEEDLVYKERVDAVVNAMRLKLNNLSKTQDEYMLRKMFKDFDSSNSNSLTPDELLAMLYKLGISVERKYLMSLFKRFDSNKNGTIEFEEFCTFITNNPYTK